MASIVNLKNIPKKFRIQYKKGFKYQLDKTYTVQTGLRPSQDVITRYITLTVDGVLTIMVGYAWDGPSGPTFDTKTFMRGSLIHDALYQLLRMGLLHQALRLACDEELYIACREDGMMKFRAWYIRRELRKFGGAAASPKNVKKIHYAP